MKITKRFIEKWKPCPTGVVWFRSQMETDAKILIEKLIEYDKCWANWLLVRCLNRENRIKYAIHAAESVIHIWERVYPNDDRPRKAIDMAKENNKVSAEAAYAVSHAANTAADSVSSDDATFWAAHAAESAVNAATSYSASYSAESADLSVANSAIAAAQVVAPTDAPYFAAHRENLTKLINYGLTLLK